MMSSSTEDESATTMDVYTGCASLGVSIVGGIDTPLVINSRLYCTATSLTVYFSQYDALSVQPVRAEELIGVRLSQPHRTANRTRMLSVNVPFP